MELIDTQWDVNALAVAACKFWAAELIDTQWDVNIYAYASAAFVLFGINRYIVGCKLIT